MSDLHTWGFGPFFEDHELADGLVPARVITQDREQYVVVGAAGERRAQLAGRLRRQWQEREEYPAVGDWVGIAEEPAGDPATIHERFPRQSLLVRKAAGARTEGQALAANVEVGLVVASLNQELNARRIERFLAGIWDSGARPAVVLNKLDLCDDVDRVLEQISSLAAAVPVQAVSALTGEGMDAVRSLLGPNETCVLVGSSGVGKSSLVNRWLGDEVQRVLAIRSGDDKGRHTTTQRQLLRLPGGGLLIDTPGIREFQLWEGAPASFDDLTALAERCRFRDCNHRTEPGCAVRAAVEDGSLEAKRLESYHKLTDELAFVARKRDEHSRVEEKQRVKQMGRMYKEAQALRRRRRGGS